jgi:integrase/recombinase XerD
LFVSFPEVNRREETIMDWMSSRVRVAGPLAPFAAGFAAELGGLGYTPLSAANQVRVLAHASRWLQAQGLEAGDFTPERAGLFLRARRAGGYTCWLSERGLAPLLGYLREAGAVPVAVLPVPCSAADVLLERYRAYLVAERGLAASTVGYYLAEARLFVAAAGPDLGGLTAAGVTGFVREQCRQRSTGMAKILVTALRALLRFLHVEGVIAEPLAGVVPAVAGWRGGALPRALGADQVTALLESCDQSSGTGRRDLAVLTLQARLGLRAAEVAALQLEDIGWRAGELLIRGKSRREERLPLPADAGAAIAGYLRAGRAGGQCRSVFLSARAPYSGLSAGAVKAIVRSAGRRAGVAPAGAHRLRHTAATQMLRAGAPLAEAGQVLRHRAASTTAIYAKVDHDALRALALPWPVTR